MSAITLTIVGSLLTTTAGSTILQAAAQNTIAILTPCHLDGVSDQNNLAMCKTVTQIAQRSIQGPTIPEDILNRIEADIRAFDPCLSCSTHAVSQMPQRVRVVAADDTLVDERTRG